MMAWILDTLVWSGALIALVLAVRRPVARVFGAGMAYALWLLPLLRLILPPVVLPAWLAPSAAPVADAPIAGAEVVTVHLAAHTPPTFALPWELLLSAAWLGGAVLFLIARVVEYREMRARLLAGAVVVDVREGVRIVETPAVDAPVAFGVREKVIAVPPRFLISGSLAERELALQHELAHHRGQDLLANMLAQGVLALHWFNPLAWAAWSAMRRDQEAACDARAMAGRDLPTRAAYARVIAGFAAGSRLNSRAALAAPMACPVLGDKSIVHRLRSLTMSDISPRRRRTARWLLGAGAALALPLTATVVYAGQDAPAEPPVPAAPQAPAAPEAPQPPEAPAAPKIVKHVIMIHDDAKDGEGQGLHDKDARFERRIERDGKTIVLRSDHEIDEATLEKKLAEMETKLAGLDHMKLLNGEMLGLLGEVDGPRKIVIRRNGPEVAGAHAMAFEGKGCALGEGAGAEADSGAGDKRQVVRIAICGAPGHRDTALKAIREARASIASDGGLGGEIRAKVLRELDEQIADMEREAK